MDDKTMREMMVRGWQPTQCRPTRRTFDKDGRPTEIWVMMKTFTRKTTWRIR
jgi:hypothetical protein